MLVLRPVVPRRHLPSVDVLVVLAELRVVERGYEDDAGTVRRHVSQHHGGGATVTSLLCQFLRRVRAPQRPPRPTVAIPLHVCGNYPEWELRSGKWALFCESCGEVVD